MQIRSKNGKRTVKLYKSELAQLAKAAELCGELGQLSGGDHGTVALKAEHALDTLLEEFLEKRTETEVLGGRVSRLCRPPHTGL